jgi:hypothetical protein
MKDMPEHERSIVEQFRIVALQYVDADAAASLMEELKTSTLERMKTKKIQELGDMADNKAERLVKSGSEWTDYIESMVMARSKADKLKLQLEYLRMMERREDRMSWLERSERKMGRSVA